MTDDFGAAKLAVMQYKVPNLKKQEPNKSEI